MKRIKFDMNWLKLGQHKWILGYYIRANLKKQFSINKKISDFVFYVREL